MTACPGIMHKWALHRALFLQLLTGCFQVFDVCSLHPGFGYMHFSDCSSCQLYCFIWGSDTGRLLIVALMALSNSCESRLREAAGNPSLLALLTQLAAGRGTVL